MANGMLGSLPPGLRGMLAAEQMGQQRSQNQLGQLSGMLSLQNAMRQQEEAQFAAPLQRQLLEAQVRGATAPKPPRQVDLGDRIGFIDDAGNLVGAIPKSATPDATLRESGADRRHTQPSGGNLLADERARSEGALNRGVTIAGMNRPVFNESAGGFVVPPPVGAPTGRPAPVGGGAPMVGGNGPRIALGAVLGSPQVIPVPGLGGGKAPPGYRFTQTGNLEAIPGGPAEAKAQSSDVERTSSGYATRMLSSGQIINDLEAQGIGTPELTEAAASKIPVAGKMLSNVAMSPERQRYRQAQEDWVRAKLRKESGAVIADEEMDREIRVYFPQIGDDPKVIKQKADSRKTAEESMVQAAGRATPTRPERRASDVEEKVKALGQAYEPSVYDYRIVNGEVQRKKK